MSYPSSRPQFVRNTAFSAAALAATRSFAAPAGRKIPVAMQKTIEFHQILGCKFLIVPGDGDFTNPDRNKALAEFFNKIAEKLKPLGMARGYHNHSKEFDKSGDSNYREQFAQLTSKDVIPQIDFGWAAVTGDDGPDLVKRYAGRTRVVYLKPTVVKKEAGKRAIFGDDSVEWGSVLTASRDFGGTEWFTLEQEAYPDGLSPMEATALSSPHSRKPSDRTAGKMIWPGLRGGSSASNSSPPNHEL
jgi:sugar phosphate isomerase/epimerase